MKSWIATLSTLPPEWVAFAIVMDVAIDHGRSFVLFPLTPGHTWCIVWADEIKMVLVLP